jgi:hypothetical protein
VAGSEPCPRCGAPAACYLLFLNLPQLPLSIVSLNVSLVRQRHGRTKARAQHATLQLVADSLTAGDARQVDFNALPGGASWQARHLRGSRGWGGVLLCGLRRKASQGLTPVQRRTLLSATGKSGTLTSPWSSLCCSRRWIRPSCAAQASPRLTGGVSTRSCMMTYDTTSASLLPSYDMTRPAAAIVRLPRFRSLHKSKMYACLNRCGVHSAL